MKPNKNPFLLAAITLAGFAFTAPAAHAATYTWTPLTAGPFNWDNASAQNNWTSGFANAAGDVAIMSGNLSANQVVNLNQAITVGSLTFGDSSGAQTTTLAPNAGSLTFDVASGNASLIRTAVGTGATTISANITLNDNLAVSRASGTAASIMTLSGIISESGGAKTLIKDSDSLTLVLSGANTFSGGVTILSGTVDQKTSTAALGSGTLVIGGAGAVNPIFQFGVNNSNAVQVNANTTGTSIIAANGTGSGAVMSGAITLNSANLNVRTFSAGTTASVTLSGGVTGTGNLLINNLSNGTAATGKVTLSGATINNVGNVTSQGTGPTANVISAVIGANVTAVIQNSATTGLNLSAVNLYTGNTTITDGTLQISGAGSLNSGSYAGAIAVTAATSTLQYSSSAAQTLSGNITGSGALTKDTSASSTLTLSGTNTYSGATTISGGTLQLGAGGTAGSLNTSSAISVASGATFAVNQSDTVTQGTDFSSAAISGAGGFKQLGSGTTILNVANTYSGATDIQGGKVIFTDSSAFGTTSLIRLGITATTQALEFGADGLNLTRNVQIQNAAGVKTMQLDLAGTNTGTLSGQLDIRLAGAGTFVINTGDADTLTVTGNVINTGTAGITKTGAGKLILSGANTYSGATKVNAGVLAVNGSLVNTSTTVGNGGTLQGSGSIVGSVTVQSGGTLATGNSIESLTTGALTLQGGSTFAYEIDNDAAASVAGDLTAVTGNLTLDLVSLANLTLTDLGTGSWSAGEKLTLISYSGAWNGGLFNYGGILADDSTFTFSGMDWSFNYNDTSAGTNYTGDLTGSNYVTMTAIPEPNFAALLGGFGVLLLFRRRR